MKSIDISMTSVEIKAETRALKCDWTRELTQDLEVFSELSIDSLEEYFIAEMRRTNRRNKIQKLFL